MKRFEYQQYTDRQCRRSYSMTSGSLWNHYRDKINDFDDNTWDSKSIEYKAKIVGNTLERPGN